MRIPKRFKLMGQTIDVVYDAKMADTDDCSGLAKYRFNQIALLPNTEGTLRLPTRIEQTFLHELIHWMFYVLGETDLRNNEKLVDSMAGLLHQALTTMEYEDK